MRGDEVLQHGEPLAEIGRDGSLDDLAGGLGHQPAHTRQLADLLGAAARPGIRHHEDGVKTGHGHLMPIFVRDGLSREITQQRIHPATKTFQALRIAVNDELGNVEQGLEAGFKVLAPGGKLAIITFQGLEDKLVKDFIKRHGKGEGIEMVTSGAVKPDFNKEINENNLYEITQAEAEKMTKELSKKSEDLANFHLAQVYAKKRDFVS